MLGAWESDTPGCESQLSQLPRCANNSLPPILKLPLLKQKDVHSVMSGSQLPYIQEWPLTFGFSLCCISSSAADGRDFMPLSIWGGEEDSFQVEYSLKVFSFYCQKSLILLFPVLHCEASPEATQFVANSHSHTQSKGWILTKTQGVKECMSHMGL